MLRRNKGLFYLNHMLLMSTNNKVRCILTSIGIFVAVFLFSIGIIVTDSYYAGNRRIIDEIREYSVVVSPLQGSNEETRKEISDFNPSIAVDDRMLSEKKSILSLPINKSQYLTIMAHVHGISDISSLVPVIAQDGLYLPVDASLLKGRGISILDTHTAANVVVIDELTESLLFPNGDGLNKYIDIGSDIMGTFIAGDADEEIADIKLKVIGVLKNSYVSTVRKQKLKKDISNSKNNVFMDTSIYIPITTWTRLFDEEAEGHYLIYDFHHRENYEEFIARIKTFSEINLKKGKGYRIITKDSLLTELKADLFYVRSLLNTILLLLFIISGISIMSITFFSVKERIPEIGIRKAFGASKTDIAFQFVFEMVLIAFFTSIWAVSLAYFSCKLAEDYLRSRLFMSFSVHISNARLLLPLFIGIIKALVCAIVPSLYAANIKVTDSLRFE